MKPQYPHPGPCDWCEKDVPTRWLNDFFEDPQLAICKVCDTETDPDKDDYADPSTILENIYPTEQP